MIKQQCDNCSKKGKNFYYNNCIKVADYFDVYKYHGNNSRFDKGQLIGRTKAYVWHDVIEYVKNNLLHNGSTSLNINCEKDFAYIEEKEQSVVTNNDNNGGGEILSGYKLYLNKEGNDSPSAADNSNKGEEQRQTLATAIEPNPANQLTPTTPTMMTRSTSKEQKEKEAKE